MFIFVLICIIVFFIFYYIFLIFGNNSTRNTEELVENIFKKYSNYTANIDVYVKSNKTENSYNITQEEKENFSQEIINKPENIKDLIIELESNTLKIYNTKLQMEKVYEDYNNITNNSLFLKNFIEDFKNNNGVIEEKNDEIILKVNIKNNPNTYIKFKELYINKQTNLPEKMIIKDDVQNTVISIIYNNIEIK